MRERMNAPRPVTSFRGLLAALIAVAVLLAPSFTRAGEALAAVPNHQMQMMEAGHCAVPATDDGDDPATKACCKGTCTAVAVTYSSAAEPQALPRSDATSSLKSFGMGQPAEIATPPPRAA